MNGILTSFHDIELYMQKINEIQKTQKINICLVNIMAGNFGLTSSTRQELFAQIRSSQIISYR